jgi:hypothetical protein
MREFTGTRPMSNGENQRYRMQYRFAQVLVGARTQKKLP